MNTAPPSAQRAFAALSDQVQQEMARHHVPGVGLGLLYEGVEQAAGFGVGSVDTQLPVDAATLFQCGSVTKTFTATMLLRLVEQGRLALDEPVRRMLPDLRLADEETAQRVTLRHLLTHTGGWYGDYFADKRRGEDALARYVADLHLLPQLTPLGAFFSYNNAGFSLAGRVIEVVTGTSWETAVRDLVFTPLQLTEAFTYVEEVITRRFAVGHLVQGETVRVVHQQPPLGGWRLPGGGNPAGGIGISARDLLRFGRLHLEGGATADGTRLLSPAVVAEMQAPQVPLSPASTTHEARGLAWWLSDLGGVRVVEHGGGTAGQAALLVLVPERGCVLVLLTNASSGAALADEVRRWTLEHLLGLPVDRRTPYDVPAAVLEEYVGRYLAPGFRGYELVMGEDGLERRELDGQGAPAATPRFPTAPVRCFATDRLVDTAGPGSGRLVSDILRRDDGQVGWVRVASRIYRRESSAP